MKRESRSTSPDIDSFGNEDDDTFRERLQSEFSATATATMPPWFWRRIQRWHASGAPTMMLALLVAYMTCINFPMPYADVDFLEYHLSRTRIQIVSVLGP